MVMRRVGVGRGLTGGLAGGLGSGVSATAPLATLATLRGAHVVLQSNSRTYSDLAGSTPQTADGGLVGRVKDLTPNGYDFQSITSPEKRPILRTATLNGITSLEFSFRLIYHNTVLTSALNSTLTIHFAIKAQNGGLTVWVQVGAGYFAQRSWTQLSIYLPGVVNSELIIPINGAYNGVWCGTLTYDGSTLTVIVNGENVHTSSRTGSLGYANSAVGIGDYGGSFNWNGGQFVALGIYSVVHDADEIRTAQRLLHRLINRKERYRSIVVGDSIAINGPDNWTDQVVAAMVAAGYPYVSYNNSHPGYAVDDPTHSSLRPLLATEVYPDFGWLTGPNWDSTANLVVLPGGSNDYLFGATDTQVIARQQSMVTDIGNYMHTNGYSGAFLIGTVMDRVDFTSITRAYVAAGNAATLGGAITSPYFPIYYLNFASLNPVMTTLDGVHPDSAGYTKMANLAVPVFQTADQY